MRKSILIVVLTMLLSSSNSWSDRKAMADETTEAVSVANFRLRNVVNPDAMSIYASPSGAIQNLYLKNDEVSPWPAWKRAFFPIYSRVTYRDDKFVYYLMYNPLEEVGFLSKWEREGSALRYVSLEACTSEYLNGSELDGNTNAQPLWEQKFLSTGTLDLTTNSLEVLKRGVERFNSAPKVQQMLAGLEKPKEYRQADTGKRFTDRDLAVSRATMAAGRLDLALRDPLKKQEIYDAMDCIREKPNSLCPAAGAGKPDIAQLKEVDPARAANLEKLDTAVIPVGFIGTLHQDLVFTSMTFAPGVLTVSVIQDQKVIQSATVDFDVVFDEVLFPDKLKIYKPVGAPN